MSFSLGIVGLPNVGKSTLFKALTRQQTLIANYPFATIDPNVGVVKVPDERLRRLSEISKSEKEIPTVIEFVDIAGLVKGASEGEGLGNKFLSHIREVAAIAQVVREFFDSDVSHVAGRVDPRNDFEVINAELALADLDQAGRKLESLKNAAKAGKNQALEKEIILFEKIKNDLAGGRAVRDINLSEEEKNIIQPFNFLTAKPMLAVLNGDESAGKNVEENFINAGEGSAVPAIRISAKLEAELADLSEEEAKAYLESAGQTQTGLEKIILAGYKLLDLVTFFTSGPKETRAWTVRRGTKAPQAAGAIHSDFEKGFIRAEVCFWRNFVDCGGEAGVKEKGLWRLEGKEYPVKDGDVCFFRFSV